MTCSSRKARKPRYAEEQKPERVLTFAMDRATKKPYCVLLQAVFGGDRGMDAIFDVDDWILSPGGEGGFKAQGTLTEWRKYAKALRAATA